MWLTFLAGLAMAQDDASRNARLLGETTEAAVATEAAAPTNTAPVATAPVTTTRPAPVQAPVSTPAPAMSVSSPFGTDFLWSFGGPLLLLVAAGGAAWWIRKNGLKMPGMARGGFAAVPEGPSVEVCSRTPLAGNDVLAVVQVQGFGAPRHLLVAAGPGGSRLLADLAPASQQASAPMSADAIAAAVQASLGQAWTAPQPHAAPVPVAAYAAPAPSGAAPSGAAPIHAAAPSGAAPSGAAQAPSPIQAAAPALHAAPARPVEVRVDATPAAPEARTDDARPQGVQDDLDFAVELQDSMDAVQLDTRPERRERSALNGRRDWRTAAYSAQDDAPDGLGDGRPAPTRNRGGEPRRAPPRARRMDDRRGGRKAEPAPRGHLEQLVRRRNGTEGGSSLRTDARSRRERTQAARALLEQVMARREQEDRR